MKIQLLISKKIKDFDDIYINYKDEKENIIFAKKGSIKKDKNKFLFNLENGFKITLLENGDIEKLEFNSDNLEFEDKDYKAYNNLDRNTSNFIQDILLKDYLNLLYKFFYILI